MASQTNRMFVVRIQWAADRHVSPRLATLLRRRRVEARALYCQDCGTRFDEADQFCGNCGAARPEPVTPDTSGITPQPHPGSVTGDPTPEPESARAPVPAPSGANVVASPGRTWTIGAFACAAIALFYIPIVFGGAGAVLGWQGSRRGDRIGKVAMWVSIGVVLLGLASAFLFDALPS